MSQKNREGKQTARERMRIERERQERRAKRAKVFGVFGGVVAVIVVVAVVIAVVQGNSGKPVAAPKSAVATGKSKDRLVLPVGEKSAPATMTVYEDFRCPACGMFEKNNHETIDKLVAEKKLRVDYHIVSFIDDGPGGGTGSKKSANAAACAVNATDPKTFFKYHDVLYKNQPDENDDAYGDNARLLKLAEQVPGLKAGKFTSCVKDGTYDPWAKAVLKDFNKTGYQSTPTILVGGKKLDNPTGTTPDQLKKLVAAAKK